MILSLPFGAAVSPLSIVALIVTEALVECGKIQQKNLAGSRGFASHGDNGNRLRGRRSSHLPLRLCHVLLEEEPKGTAICEQKCKAEQY